MKFLHKLIEILDICYVFTRLASFSAVEIIWPLPIEKKKGN